MTDSIFEKQLKQQLATLGQVPSLTEAQTTQGVKVLNALKSAMGNDTWSFERLMGFALYEPGLGYYAAGSTKFGLSGDFTTAPEISPLFSGAVARQCAQILQELNGGEILEVGAGSGKMAVDIMLELERIEQLPERYCILEISADLQERQQQQIQACAPHLFKKFVWMTQWPSEAIEGIILGNELIDAIPCQLMKIQNGEPVEVGVSWSAGGELMQTPMASASQETQKWYQRRRDQRARLPEGYLTEVHVQAWAWLQTAAKVLQQGAIVLIDYGFPDQEYYHEQRDQGTLMCHYRHHAHANPLILLGLQDITTHVDFTELAEVADKAGLHVAGFCTQMSFLMAMQVTQHAERLMQTDPEKAINLSQGLKKILMPQEMGELFKCIAFTKNITQPLEGFMLQDMRARL
ncbi:MAG: SAM-dependent methyltransferase [Pseudomonadota bacterium]